MASSSSRAARSVHVAAPSAASASTEAGASGPIDREGRQTECAIDHHLDRGVGHAVVGEPAVERRQLDAPGVRRARGARRDLGRAGRDRLVEGRVRHQLVDEAPVECPAPARPFLHRAEDVGPIAPHTALVGDAGQPAGAGQHGQQRQLGQGHVRRAVIREHDVVAGERELVAAAGAGTANCRDPVLVRLLGGRLHGVARLVGELAEVDLVGMAGAGQHPDVRAGAEDALLARHQHHGPHLGVLEAQPLHGVGELDVDAQVVGVELELVAG